MLTVVPSGKDQFELPLQNLAGIWGFWYYYEYTGDKSIMTRRQMVHPTTGQTRSLRMKKRYKEMVDFDYSTLWE